MIEFIKTLSKNYSIFSNQYSLYLTEHTWLDILTSILTWATIGQSILFLLFMLSLLYNFSLTVEEKMIKFNKILELKLTILPILLALHCILLFYTIFMMNL